VQAPPPDAGPSLIRADPARRPGRLTAGQRQLHQRRLLLARQLLRRGRPDQAKRLLAQALAQADGVDLRELLSSCHERLGELDLAAYHLEQALLLASRRLKPRLQRRLDRVRGRAGAIRRR